ncbi:MAG: zinc ribbon domain-containing protein [Chloroflexi bacterium]|nr:zinc ribbon domain-containing protein [Chloroflexota bacterium]
MPIYEYECKDCREPFEVFVRSMSARVQAVCPKCGGEHVQREVTAASALGMSGAAASASVSSCAPSG